MRSDDSDDGSSTNVMAMINAATILIITNRVSGTSRKLIGLRETKHKQFADAMENALSGMSRDCSMPQVGSVADAVPIRSSL